MEKTVSLVTRLRYNTYHPNFVWDNVIVSDTMYVNSELCASYTNICNVLFI
jgi:hypothetical protein